MGIWGKTKRTYCQRTGGKAGKASARYGEIVRTEQSKHELNTPNGPRPKKGEGCLECEEKKKKNEIGGGARKKTKPAKG